MREVSLNIQVKGTIKDMITKWQLSWIERFKILFKGYFYICVEIFDGSEQTSSHVILSVEEPEELNEILKSEI